jgi:hypothetical protein
MSARGGEILDNHSKTYWHGAFFEAMQLELHEYKDVLEFYEEHHLSKEALRMDVLVVKKNKDVKIEKNIGKIFRKHNILEFKSELDSFSCWDYNKILGYAFLYSSFEQIPLSDITISVSLTMYPRELIKHLESERGFKVQTAEPGIHYIRGDIVPIQILESKELPPKSNVFLHSLRSNLTAVDMRDTLNSYKELKPLNEKNVYLDRIIKANPIAFEEATKMTAETIEIIIKAAEESGWLAARENNSALEKAKSIAKKMLMRGHSVDEVVETTDLPMETIMSLK